jgi:hypothetical protein
MTWTLTNDIDAFTVAVGEHGAFRPLLAGLIRLVRER